MQLYARLRRQLLDTNLGAAGEELFDRMLRIPAIDVGVFEHNFRANAIPATVGHLNHTRALLVRD